MPPVDDALYRAHQLQASRRGVPPLAYADFQTRVKLRSDTDLTQLLPPPPDLPNTIRRPRFTLGKLCVTPAAALVLTPHELLVAVARHAVGDWGELEKADRQENEQALGNRGRLVSVYEAGNGTRFYVITDPGWETTTILLPEDY
jgi:hypothetical protein